ncbi:hypothetical protein QYM36_003040 [Artemia franciscana]|uniref:Uncharacterized protein n=1 Tax=Artemia franciscana TaxID=6661 RepID=A0AA88I6F9_ARTSF|nr:hypothetical protein QYM36_003040 [Artemia franciscana]
MDVKKNKSKTKGKARTDNYGKKKDYTETDKANLKKKKTHWYHKLNPFCKNKKKVLAKDKNIQTDGVPVWLGDFYQINDKIHFSPAISQSKDIKQSDTSKKNIKTTQSNDDVISSREKTQKQRAVSKLAHGDLRIKPSQIPEEKTELLRSRENKRNVFDNVPKGHSPSQHPKAAVMKITDDVSPLKKEIANHSEHTLEGNKQQGNEEMILRPNNNTESNHKIIRTDTKDDDRQKPQDTGKNKAPQKPPQKEIAKPSVYTSKGDNQQGNEEMILKLNNKAETHHEITGTQTTHGDKQKPHAIGITGAPPSPPAMVEIKTEVIVMQKENAKLRVNPTEIDDTNDSATLAPEVPMQEIRDPTTPHTANLSLPITTSNNDHVPDGEKRERKNSVTETKNIRDRIKYWEKVRV